MDYNKMNELKYTITSDEMLKYTGLEKELKECKDWIEIELNELADDDQTLHLDAGRKLLGGE